MFTLAKPDIFPTRYPDSRSVENLYLPVRRTRRALYSRALTHCLENFLNFQFLLVTEKAVVDIRQREIRTNILQGPSRYLSFNRDLVTWRWVTWHPIHHGSFPTLFLGFHWVVFGVFSDVCLHMFPLMECILAHVTLVIWETFCEQLTWRQLVAFPTLLFGRRPPAGWSSQSTAVNMGETKEILDFKRNFRRSFLLGYRWNHRRLGFFVFSRWGGLSDKRVKVASTAGSGCYPAQSYGRV